MINLNGVTRWRKRSRAQRVRLADAEAEVARARASLEQERTARAAADDDYEQAMAELAVLRAELAVYEARVRDITVQLLQPRDGQS